MTADPQPSTSNRRSGFTLLELIGVMVVIAILSVAVLPSAVDIIRVQRTVNEAAELPKIADALKRGMLREQSFPAFTNSSTVGTTTNSAYWWNLAARHGGGSANEIRYPLGVRPGSTTTRKLYFADSSWDGDSFFDITQGDWIDPTDPQELRALLLSTTNPDLTLPDTLNQTIFNKLWDDWALGTDGNPADGTGWASYGLTATEWNGRGSELALQRIDLRDWLCTVVIENRKGILDPNISGSVPDQGSAPVEFNVASDNWIDGSTNAYTTGLADSEILIRPQAGDQSLVESVILAKRGRILNNTITPQLTISGTKAGAAVSTTTNIPLTLTTDYAPIALIEAGGSGNTQDLTLPTGSVSDQALYFLYGQELLLGEPWGLSEVGVYTITEPINTLRFDGLQWQY